MSTYSTNLGIELIGTGEQAGTWGVTTNSNLGTLIEQAISGYVTQAITDGAATVITIPNGATGVARNMTLELTGALTAARVLEVPANKKLYFIYNNTTGGYAVTVKVSGQTGVSVPNGKKMVLVSNGTDIVEAVNYVGSFSATSINNTPIGNSVPSTGAFTTLSASSTVSGVGFSNYLASPPAIGGTAAAAGSFTTLSASSTVSGVGFSNYLASPPAIGGTAAAAGSFTTLSASSTVSGTGFSNYLASPPAIGGTAAAAGSFTTLSASSTVTFSGGTANGVVYLNGSKVATSGSALVFDGSNLGLGVTPSGWNTGKAFEMGGGSVYTDSGNNELSIAQGAYNNSGWKYKYTGVAAGLASNYQGTHIWYTAPSGTAGAAITFTQAMTLDASGNLGIGTSSPTNKLQITTSSDDGLRISATSDPSLIFSETTANKNWKLKPSAGNLYWQYSATAYNSGYSSLMTLDSSGNLGLGVTPSAWGNSGYGMVQVKGNAAFGGLNYGAGYTIVSNNAYDSALGANKYLSSGYATQYFQTSGQHLWYTAPSGTAGAAITFTQAMALDASGNLGLGVTPSAWGSSFVAAEIGPGCGIYANRTSGQDCEMFSNFYTTNAAGYYKQNGYATRYAQTSGQHQWFNATSGTAGAAITFTQAMTLDASGNLLVGTTSAGGNNTTGQAWIYNSGSSYGSLGHVTGTGSGTGYLQFLYAGGVIGSITQNGTTGVLYNITSDQRLKTNIVNAPDASLLIDSIKVRSFDWLADGSHQRYGMVAQELLEVAPEAVCVPTDEDEMMGVDYSKLVPMLVKEIQSLRARVANLEK